MESNSERRNTSVRTTTDKTLADLHDAMPSDELSGSEAKSARVEKDNQQVGAFVGVNLRREKDRNEKRVRLAEETASLLRQCLGEAFHAYPNNAHAHRDKVEEGTILEVEITVCSDGKRLGRPFQLVGGPGTCRPKLDVRWLLKSNQNGHVFIREKEAHYRGESGGFALKREGVENAMSRIAKRASSDIAQAVKTDLETIMNLGTDPYNELKWTDPPIDEKPTFSTPTGTQERIQPPANVEELALPTGTKARHRLPINAETTALLVVDVQPEYWSKCPAVRRDFPDFPEKLQKTIAVCRARGTKIIFVRADYRYSHSPWLVQFARLHADKMTEVPCDPNAEDFRWEEFATPEGGDLILPKTSWSSCSNTKLMEWLSGAGIDTVLVCGLITSVCVQHSAFSIFEAGFRTLLVTDAAADRGRARHDAALALYGDYMYELVNVDDLDDPEHGLIKAEPVWLTLDETKENEPVEPRPFSKFQDVVTMTGWNKTIVSTF